MKKSDDSSARKKIVTGHSLFLIENIVPPGTIRAIHIPDKRDRMGA